MSTKRFIAGASCPGCGELDKIFVEKQDGKTRRACVNCDFSEWLDDLPQTGEELPTRVNQHRLGEEALAHETPVEKVRLLDPSKPRGKDG